MRRLWLMVCFGVAVGLSALAQQTPPPQNVFRAGVDLVELDVSVFDKDRHPVRGLAATDFTVLEDGQPRAIEVFSPVEMPDPPPATASWMKAPPVDVDANDVNTGRLFVIVMDDQNLQGLALPATAVARKVVESLGPLDQAAVVFTVENWKGQGFTADRGRLMAAIDSMGPAQAGTRSFGSVPAATVQSCEFLDVLREVVDDLKTIPHRRKFVVLVSGAVTCKPRMLMAGEDGFLITRAQTEDINIYSVSPSMLNAVSPAGSFLNGLAEPTGGRAIIDTNDPVPRVAEIFDENRSYYLVGFVSENLKHRESLKKIEVRVDRPDLTVRSRSLYDAPNPTPPAAPTKPPPPPALAAIADLVPKGDLPLRATAIAVADPGGATSTAVIVVGVREPTAIAGATDVVDVTGVAFTPDGREVGNLHQVTTLTLTPDSATPGGALRGEVLARLPSLKPGRYNLRISVKSQASGKDGSVYTDVMVPDVAKEPIALSGLAFSASPGLHGAPRDVVARLLPVVPTAARTFDRTQQVSLFVHAYQAPGAPAAAVTMRVHVVDDHDATVVDRPSTIPAAVFVTASADFRYTLPVGAWHPGAYLVSVTATAGKHVATREVAIEMR